MSEHWYCCCCWVEVMLLLNRSGVFELPGWWHSNLNFFKKIFYNPIQHPFTTPSPLPHKNPIHYTPLSHSLSHSSTLALSLSNVHLIINWKPKIHLISSLLFVELLAIKIVFARKYFHIIIFDPHPWGGGSLVDDEEKTQNNLSDYRANWKLIWNHF